MTPVKARMERNRKFLDPNNWRDIKRGWIFEAIVNITPERPLQFFIRDGKDSSNGYIKPSNGDFIPGQIPEIVVKLKTRKVLILATNDLAQDVDVFDVTVAPIYGIYEDDREEEWYEDLIKGRHAFFVHLPKEVTGRECLIDLTNVISINKNMILEEKYDITERMAEVEKRLEYCLELGVYSKTKQKNDETAV